MNKKIYIPLIVGIVAIIAILVIFLLPKGVKISTEQEVTKKFDNRESFVMVIGDSFCLGCIEYKEGTITEYVNKHGQNDLVYLYTDKITFGNSTDFNAFKTKYHFTYPGSPTTYYVKNGQVVAMIEGVISLSRLEKLIEDNK